MAPPEKVEAKEGLGSDAPEVSAQKTGYSSTREYFVTIATCTLFALFVTTYVVHPMTVPTPSMDPTIRVGDRLLIDKFTIRNSLLSGLKGTPKHPIQRKDVVVFKFPRDPEILYVKRVIGLPGETLTVRDQTVSINGRALQEPYAIYSLPHGMRENFPPFAVPQEHVFVMGDNRDDSADSRYFGPLPIDHIVGRPLIVFWSYQDPPSAHTVQGWNLLKLYAERILYFVPRTRWSRFGHLIR